MNHWHSINLRRKRRIGASEARPFLLKRNDPLRGALEEINSKISSYTAVFSLTSASLASIYLIFYLGLKRLDFLVFIDVFDIAKLAIFFASLPILVFIFSMHIVFVKKLYLQSESLGGKFIAVWPYILIPLLWPLVLIYATLKSELPQDRVDWSILKEISLVWIALCVLAIIAAVLTLVKDFTVRACLSMIFLVVLSALLGAFLGSLNSSEYGICYDVKTKDVDIKTEDLLGVKLVLNLTKGSLFDLGNSRPLFIRSDNITALRQSGCNDRVIDSSLRGE